MCRGVFVAVVLCVVRGGLAGDGEWTADVLLECDHGLGGAAIGDLDPDSPGKEVVAVSAAGEVWLVRGGATHRAPECIHRSAGELIMGAIGDAVPDSPGCEFVGVGMVSGPESLTGPGQVLLIHRQGKGWQATPIFRDDHMIHGVALGDVAARYPGNEIVVCGFSHRVTLLRREGARWRDQTIYVASDRLKIAAIADVLPQREGLEVLVCGSDGRVVALWEGQLGWCHEVVYADPVGQSRVAAGAAGVLIGGDGGKVTLARRQDAGWRAECLARQAGKIRGVAVADVDPEVPGAELYACGYSRNVVQLVRDAGGFWHSRRIFSGQRPLHHLVAGDFDAAHPGSELVTCGHGGRLILLTPAR